MLGYFPVFADYEQNHLYTFIGSWYMNIGFHFMGKYLGVELLYHKVCVYLIL